MEVIKESQVNIISSGTNLNGKVIFDHTSRVFGTLGGEIQSKTGSTLIIAESGLVEGTVVADKMIIDGYVKGDIEAKTSVKISRTGRVIGNLNTPSVIIEFGGYFEGSCIMNGVNRPEAAE